MVAVQLSLDESSAKAESAQVQGEKVRDGRAAMGSICSATAGEVVPRRPLGLTPSAFRIGGGGQCAAVSVPCSSIVVRMAQIPLRGCHGDPGLAVARLCRLDRARYHRADRLPPDRDNRPNPYAARYVETGGMLGRDRCDPAGWDGGDSARAPSDYVTAVWSAMDGPGRLVHSVARGPFAKRYAARVGSPYTLGTRRFRLHPVSRMPASGASPNSFDPNANTGVNANASRPPFSQGHDLLPGLPAQPPAPAQLVAWIDQTMAQLGACRMLIAAWVSGQLPTNLTATPREAAGELPPRKLTAAEAAERLQVQVPTINAWCVAGKFPSAQSLGKAGWRIPLAEVDAVRIELPTRGRMRRAG